MIFNLLSSLHYHNASIPIILTVLLKTCHQWVSLYFHVTCRYNLISHDLMDRSFSGWYLNFMGCSTIMWYLSVSLIVHVCLFIDQVKYYGAEKFEVNRYREAILEYQVNFEISTTHRNPLLFIETKNTFNKIMLRYMMNTQ